MFRECFVFFQFTSRPPPNNAALSRCWASSLLLIQARVARSKALAPQLSTNSVDGQRGAPHRESGFRVIRLIPKSHTQPIFSLTPHRLYRVSVSVDTYAQEIALLSECDSEFVTKYLWSWVYEVGWGPELQADTSG